MPDYKIPIWFLIILFPLSRVVFAQNIPADRLIDWSVAGVSPDFNIPTNQVSAMDFGAVADGTTNDAPAIQAAINSFGGRAGIVFLASGTFMMNNPISVADSIILKGSGSDQTTLKFDLGGLATNCFNISKGQNASFQALISGFDKGCDKITVASAASFTAGDYAEIRQANGNWDTNPASWAVYSVGQIVKIGAISGDTLLLENPIRFDYSSTLNPEIRKISPRKNVGIECIKIIRLDEPTEAAGSNIDIAYAANCRIAGIESDHSVAAHINLHFSTNIEVSGCYFHDAFVYDGSGTRGYGVCMSMHTGECLVENNIFKNLRHAMMVKTGSNGNVFAYNYSIEPHRSETISDFSGDISLHGHFAYANLFEGNICQNIIVDHYWGPSGQGNTFLRNRVEWYGIIMTADNGYSTNQQNFIGNEITENGYNFLIQLWFGLYYVLTGNDHFEWGNNSDGDIIPSGTVALDTKSLYLNYAPQFWDEEIEWPSIGWPNNLNSATIPARHRFENEAVKTVCPPEQISQNIILVKGWSGISSFVNPYPQDLEYLFQPLMENIEIIFNSNGAFYPYQNPNTLQKWNWKDGFFIKMKNNCSLNFKGLNCAGSGVTIDPGWNLFPVLSESPLSTDSVAVVNQGNIIAIKEIAGEKVYWPQQHIYSLKWLLPGKAYLIKTEASFIFRANKN